MTIFHQLGLDYTFFVQLGLISVVYFLLSSLYFKPFMRLFEVRHKRTIEDREAAKNLMEQAHTKLQEYKKRLTEESAAARKEYEAAITEAKKEEAKLLTQTRDSAKKIVQEALESAGAQRDQLKKSLESEVASLAKAVSESLLVRKDG
ncbi:ATP synthase F0 subunit B [bacterium]|nr:ATP synthase F0 subunit B [bacterium]